MTDVALNALGKLLVKDRGDGTFLLRASVQSDIIRSTVDFTRPANITGYSAGQALAPNGANALLTFTNAAREAAGGGTIVQARMVKTGTGTTGQFRLWLFSASPASIPASDQAAYSPAWANRVIRLGHVDFTSWIAGSDCAVCEGALSGTFGFPFKLAAGTSLFGIAEARASYVPASGEQFHFALGIYQG